VHGPPVEVDCGKFLFNAGEMCLSQSRDRALYMYAFTQTQAERCLAMSPVAPAAPAPGARTKALRPKRPRASGPGDSLQAAFVRYGELL
jgi:hypothetical protein